LSPGRRSRSVPDLHPTRKRPASRHRKRGAYSAYSAFSADILATVPDSLPCLPRPAVGACRRAGLHRGTFLAFLAYHSIFFLHEIAGPGGLSLFSLTKCILFSESFAEPETQRMTHESPKTTYRGCKPDPSRIGIFPQAAQPSHTGQRPMRALVSAREPADPWSKSHERATFFPTPATNAGCRCGKASPDRSAEFWFCIRARL
jgi:hypothetical protein